MLDNNIFTVDQRACENSQTSLHFAVQWNNIAATKFLLKRNADINAEYKYGGRKNTLGNVFGVTLKNGIKIDHLKMTKLLVMHGVKIPDNINEVISGRYIHYNLDKGFIKNFLLFIQKLEIFHAASQKSNFDNAYKALDDETQEIWNIRVSRNDLKKLTNFIDETFSQETVIKYEEYDQKV